MIHFSDISSVTDGNLLRLVSDTAVADLLTDSRKPASPLGTVFFALKGERHDGHRFLAELYEKGFRNFVTENTADVTEFLKQCPGANIVSVPNGVEALQKLAAYKREVYHIPVIGITGSNAKTIIKEWLAQLFAKDQSVIASPQSYNSQIGVPLSVWRMSEVHTLGIFEAGISRPGEMEKLERIIRPTMGIFTNIGSAHGENFSSREEKIVEKLRLFTRTDILFYCRDHETLHEVISKHRKDFKFKTFTWSEKYPADLTVKVNASADLHQAHVEGQYLEKKVAFQLPFSDKASVENVLHCTAVMLWMKYEPEEIQKRISFLKAVPMRLELVDGINGCYLINDTYNNDPAGLETALDFMKNQHLGRKKTLILSDVLQTGLSEEARYERIAGLLNRYGIERFIGIGEALSRQRNFFQKHSEFYENAEEFLDQLADDSFDRELILIKGARIFHFEKITERLRRRIHGTVFEINLNALTHNLNYYKSKLAPDTKLMVMVKAFAYGSGNREVASLLQFQGVDYLAVAYTDEGVELRENGITLPIMVMNPSSEDFDYLKEYRLEPAIGDFETLVALFEYLEEKNDLLPIHLEFDTGMKRLGFEPEEKDKLFALVKKFQNRIMPVSIFSHLAGADEAVHEAFSLSQIELFRCIAEEAEVVLERKLIKHILNSAGIVRFPEHRFDMVRLGIGLYGAEVSGLEKDKLKPIGQFKTTISKIRHVKSGETIGYGRRGTAAHDMDIAVIAAGYADGYDRRFGNGVGRVYAKGKLCPVVGNVCMDMTMIDVTGADAKKGDEVILFGEVPDIASLAQSIGTIPYEILTGIGTRVKRLFHTD